MLWSFTHKSQILILEHSLAARLYTIKTVPYQLWPKKENPDWELGLHYIAANIMEWIFLCLSYWQLTSLAIVMVSQILILEHSLAARL